MKKVIRLTESDLNRIVKRTIKEYGNPYDDYQLQYMRDNPEERYPKPLDGGNQLKFERMLNNYNLNLSRHKVEEMYGDLINYLNEWIDNNG